MKIAPKAVGGFLLRPDGAAVLFYGPDTGLARERSEQIVQVLLGKQYDALSVLELYESRLLSDPAMLADELSAVSLMADKRVILIREATDKLTKILESATDLLRADVYIVALAGELSTRSSLRLWFESVPNAAAIACYHDEARDLGELVRDSFTKAGISASQDVVPYLVAQLGNDRYVTRQEIEKIITYLGNEKHLRLEDVQQLTDYNRETEMDEVINAMADRNLAGFDKAVFRLIKEGVQPVAYLRGLSRYFQRLYAIKLQAENSSVERVIEGLRPKVFYKQVPFLTRHVKQWDFNAIAKALSLIASAELMCKSSDIPAVAASEREVFKAMRG